MHDGRITAVTTYCNGGWDEGLRARHAAEAPMIRPPPSSRGWKAGRVSPTLEALDRVAAALEVELAVGFSDAQRHQHAPVVSEVNHG